MRDARRAMRRVAVILTRAGCFERTGELVERVRRERARAHTGDRLEESSARVETRKFLATESVVRRTYCAITQ